MKIYVEQDGKITPHESDVPVLHIGRAQGNELVIDEPRSSRKHCRVLATPHGHFLEDLGSRNGTLLNGAKTDKAALSEGDTIEIGKTRLYFGAPPGESAGAQSADDDVGSDVIEDVPTVVDGRDSREVADARAVASTVIASAGGDDGGNKAGAVEGVSLEALSGPRKGETIEISRVPFTIGRKADNDLSLDDARSSGHHARIVEKDDGFYIEDLGSKNGTQVNSRLITEPTRLVRGVKIVVGEGKYRVRVPKRAVPAGEPAAEISRVNLEDFAESQGNQVLLVLGLLVIVGAILFYAIDIGRRISERRDLDPSPKENLVGREHWSFEGELPEGESVPGWSEPSGAAQLYLVKSARGVRFPGLQALGVRSTQAENGLVRATYYQDFNVTPGATYFLSCHAFNARSQAAGLLVEWMKDSDNPLGSRSYTRAVLEQDEGDVASRVVAPSGARHARLSCFVLASAGSGGEAVFDRIYFGAVAPAWMTDEGDAEAANDEAAGESRSTSELAQNVVALKVKRATRQGSTVNLTAEIRPQGIVASVQRGRMRVLESMWPGLTAERDPLRIGPRMSCTVFHAQEQSGMRMSARLPDIESGEWTPLEINCRQSGSEILARYVTRSSAGSSTPGPTILQLFLELASTRVDWRAFDLDGMMTVATDSVSNVVELNLGRGKELMAIRFEPAVNLRVSPTARGGGGPVLILSALVDEVSGGSLALQMSPVSMREDSDISNRIHQATRLYESGRVSEAFTILDQAGTHYKDERLDTLRQRWEADAVALLVDLGESFKLFKRTGATLLREELEGRTKLLLKQYGKTPKADEIEGLLGDLKSDKTGAVPSAVTGDELLARGRAYLNDNRLELAELYLREAQRVNKGGDSKGEIEHLLNLLEKRKQRIALVGS